MRGMDICITLVYFLGVRTAYICSRKIVLGHNIHGGGLPKARLLHEFAVV